MPITLRVADGGTTRSFAAAEALFDVRLCPAADGEVVPALGRFRALPPSPPRAAADADTDGDLPAAVSCCCVGSGVSVEEDSATSFVRRSSST